MDDQTNKEIERLNTYMQAVRSISEDARLKAEKAYDRQQAHDELCALRYETISAKLEEIPRIFATMQDIRRQLYTGVGIWTGTLAVSAVLGMLYLVYRFGAGQ